MFDVKLKGKIISVITSIACTAICIPAMSLTTSAVSSGNLEYVTYEDAGYAELISCDASAVKEEIPSTIMGLPVTKIAAGAFYNCADLSTVTLPNTIESIGSNAFSGCTKLVTANIPDNVTSVGKDAFKNTALIDGQTNDVKYVDHWVVASNYADTVDIRSNTVGIADSSFSGKGLKSLTIPADVKYIGNNAFSSNNDLRSVAIPSKVEVIGSYAFYNCPYIQQLSIGQSVKRIDASAFQACERIKSVKIPDSVTYIGLDAFEGTELYKTQLTNEIYIDTWVVDCIPNTQNTSINIKSGTRGIAVGAFSGIDFVESLTMPSSLVSICDAAFMNCSLLKEAIIPDGVETIGSYAYVGTLISKMDIPESVNYIGYNAFADCSNLKEISVFNEKCVITDGANTLGNSANLKVYPGSTAEAYAQKYKKSFDKLETYTRGDVDENGIINIFDAVLVAKYTVNAHSFTSAQLAAADYNQDKKINVFDAVAIAKHTVGID